jgi:hypothetical protein
VLNYVIAELAQETHYELSQHLNLLTFLLSIPSLYEIWKVVHKRVFEGNERNLCSLGFDFFEVAVLD